MLPNWWTLAPDAILAHAPPVWGLQQKTRTIPIVFVQVADPIVRRLRRKPGASGVTSRFSSFEDTMSAKWLELLQAVAPHITRWGYSEPGNSLSVCYIMRRSRLPHHRSG